MFVFLFPPLLMSKKHLFRSYEIIANYTHNWQRKHAYSHTVHPKIFKNAFFGIFKISLLGHNSNTIHFTYLKSIPVVLVYSKNRAITLIINLGIFSSLTFMPPKQYIREYLQNINIFLFNIF